MFCAVHAFAIREEPLSPKPGRGGGAFSDTQSHWRWPGRPSAGGCDADRRRAGGEDPALLRQLADGTDDGHSLTLLRSERSMTDCRPISLFSLQTVRQLGEEVGAILDKRRFRANVYLDLGAAGGFSEDGLVGRRLRISSKSRRLGRRPGPALPDDHARSGHGRAEPGGAAQSCAGSRWHSGRLRRGPGGGNNPRGR